MEANMAAFHANIVKLTEVGFLVELCDIFVRVNDQYDVSFELPVMGKYVIAQTKIVKTYDRLEKPVAPPVTANGELATGKNSQTVRIAEFHFKRLPAEQLSRIKKFLVAINQVSR